jgi:redox-sensitive bicupin YhaK (pirin superfamily)
VDDTRTAADLVLDTVPLTGTPWPTIDPFLFCVHHDDRYPAGNGRFGPAPSLAGRELGADFAGVDGWRMYHGLEVPGFPQHPHRGFETVTIVRRGLIDHSDSLGATARFGGGDVQWLTAGKGICHSEMFPLLDAQQGNPLELFQIWLNLPAADKMVDPHFTMLWGQDIPTRRFTDEAGRATEVTAIAGPLGEAQPPPPPPHSWAARPDTDLAIWTIRMAPGARWTLPAAQRGSNRTLYFFVGSALTMAGKEISRYHGVELRANAAVPLENGPEESELLLLQGRPIAEPVAQYGPFVMNDNAGIEQALADYRATGFGGWPWPVDDPVHERSAERFARDPSGTLLVPESATSNT